jgi:hypothetical protein
MSRHEIWAACSSPTSARRNGTATEPETDQSRVHRVTQLIRCG